MTISNYTKQQIKSHLKDYIDEIAKKGSNGLYFDPTDPSDSKASLSIYDDGMKFKNFGNGGEHTGDIITLYAEMNHLNPSTDFIKICEELARKFNIDLKLDDSITPTERKKETEKPQENFTEYYKRLKSATLNTQAKQYMNNRFFTDDLITKHNILFDEKENLIIIPVSQYYYKGRSIFENAKYKHYNPKGATTEIWNSQHLQDSTEATQIFITESITDALSIEYADPTKKVIALNSTTYKNKFYDDIKKYNYKGKFILMLDADDTGIKASADIKKELEAMGIFAFICNKKYNDYGGEWKETGEAIDGKKVVKLTIKDFNEMTINLQGNKDILKRILENTETEAQEEYRQYIYKDLTPTTEYITQFEKEIKESNLYTPTATGIKELDKVLNGGFFAKQIITLIADTSIGKTAFALQVADKMAENKPVLYFSLEMSQSELIARSISRNIAQWDSIDPDTLRDIKFNQIEILQGKQFETTTGLEAYEQAKSEYIEKVKDNLFIYECLEDKENTITEITNKINKFIAKTKSKPQVFIDYMQYIDADLKNGTDKQAIDKIIRELKRIARTQAINIFLISSKPRNASNKETELESGKGSGDIEYTSDIVIGLDLTATENAKTTASGTLKAEEKKKQKQARKQYTRNIYLTILKNRNGQRDIQIKNIDFTPSINYFDFSKAYIE